MAMLGAELGAADYLARCSEVLGALDAAHVEALAADLHTAYDARRMVFVCGNGGSGSNASHFSGDAAKSTLCRDDYLNDDMPRLRILSLADNMTSVLAWGNDEGFDRVFVEQLKPFAEPGDVLLAISGSGNSPNVLRAVEWANEHGVLTWGITGFDGGALRREASRSLHIPLDDMGMVESIHLLLLHWVINDLFGRINSSGRYGAVAAGG